MASNTELMKQYKALVRTVDSFSNGQASIGESPNGEDEDTLTTLYINISPNDGPYNGGTFLFKFDLSDGYPDNPPRINCLTKVYHPNIDQIDEYSEGEICLNLMDELWAPELTLEDFVQGLLFMFYNPNIEDPLNPAFNGSEDQEEFEENVLRSMRGEEVDGIVYEKVLNMTTPTVTKDEEEKDGLVEKEEEEDSKTGETTSLITCKVDIVDTDSARDDATGQCEEEEVVTKDYSKDDAPKIVPRPPDHAPWIGYSMGTLMLVGVSVWAGFQLLKRVR